MFLPATLHHHFPWRRVGLAWLALLLLVTGLFPAPVVALGTPAPLAPPDGATIEATLATPLAIPELRWSAVQSATKYRIQFSQDPGFATKVEYTTANTSFTPTDSSKFPDGTWYWRVRADTPTPAGNYSPTFSFVKRWSCPATVPTLAEPEDALWFDFVEPTTFSWQPVIGAASYRVQIATSREGFGTPVHNQVTLNTAHQPTTKLAAGVYYWRVIPRDANDREGPPSEVREFTVSYTGIPALIAPLDHATPTFTPEFRWTAVEGAMSYILQYTTDPSFAVVNVTQETRSTSFTPETDLPNDVNYYWRVRARFSTSVYGDWSQARTFRKQWYLQPVLLTPTPGYSYTQTPYFSWTPVPGAARYRFELHATDSFPPDTTDGYTDYTANPYFTLPVGKIPLSKSTNGNWYWRVIPLDANGQAGKESARSWFHWEWIESPAWEGYGPQQISPLYYYPPNAYGEGTTMSPFEDRTAPYPVFQWHRLEQAPYYGVPSTAAYRVQVSTDPNMAGDIVWTFDTENLAAAPTESAPFSPLAGVDYYWRVAPLDGVGGNVSGPWSQIWRARFDAARGMPPDPTDTAPLPLRPAYGSECVEMSPLLEWRPLGGADAYDVAISVNPDLADATITRVFQPAYAPPVLPTYPGDPAHDLPYGTYYWRVRAVSGGVEGAWSNTWRYQIASQSRWRETRTPGDVANRVLIATDSAGDAPEARYDVRDLYVSQDAGYWYFGFTANAGADGVIYALYLDLDHDDNSGATGGPAGFGAPAVAAHQPEYALFVRQNGGAITLADVTVYVWTGSGWTSHQLNGYGEALTYVGDHVELQVADATIGMGDGTGYTSPSASVALVTLPAGGGAVQDACPSGPHDTLARFASVSERLSVVLPPNDPATRQPFPSVPPFFWHTAVDTDVYGFIFQAAVDAQFTSVQATYEYRTKDLPGFDPQALAYHQDFNGDNTYYWRVQPIYDKDKRYFGAWSEPVALEREGYVPGDLATSVTFATPTFSWSRVEGAYGYDLQVDTDPNFGSPDVNKTSLDVPSYTPTTTLGNATYYWRVRMRRHHEDSGTAVINDWTPAQAFTLALPAPGNLHYLPVADLVRAPTLCWDPVLAAPEGDAPVLAAYKYRVQVARDASFSTIWDTVDTEQPAWSPTKGYENGTHYWRVAIV